LKATPEPTQLECLSYAFILGKLLVLPANVRLGWKVFARCKHSSLFLLFIGDEEKIGFIALTPGWALERDKLPVPAMDPSGFRPQSPRTDCSSWNPEIRETAHPSKLKSCWCPDC